MSPHTTPNLPALYQELDEIPIESTYLQHYKRFLNLLVLGSNTLALPDALRPILEQHQSRSKLDWQALNSKIVKKPFDGAVKDTRAEALFASYLNATRVAYLEHFYEEPEWISTETKTPDVCVTTNNQF